MDLASPESKLWYNKINSLWNLFAIDLRYFTERSWPNTSVTSCVFVFVKFLLQMQGVCMRDNKVVEVYPYNVSVYYARAGYQ